MRLFGIVPVRGRRTTDREIPEGKGGPPDVKKYTLKRILTSLFTLLAILLVLFILMQLMPGSPFNDEKLTPDMRAALYAKYGLDQPIYIQFFRYVGNMLRGDLGVSYNISKNTPISQLIQSRLPISIQVGGMAVTLGAAVGLVIFRYDGDQYGKVSMYNSDWPQKINGEELESVLDGVMFAG